MCLCNPVSYIQIKEKEIGLNICIHTGNQSFGFEIITTGCFFLSALIIQENSGIAGYQYAIYCIFT